MFAQGHKIDAQTVCKALGVRERQDVKAVVLRINSGRRFCLFRTDLHHETGKQKPVVVSNGWHGGTGGYYMSAPAN